MGKRSNQRSQENYWDVLSGKEDRYACTCWTAHWDAEWDIRDRKCPVHGDNPIVDENGVYLSVRDEYENGEHEP